MERIEIGNIGIGGVFAYEDAIFVVMPFNWEENKYKNLCIADRKSTRLNSSHPSRSRMPSSA